MYLIRHGQSEYNLHSERLGRDPQIPDAPLTPLGLEQARRAGTELAGKGIKFIIASPYTRALQTATAIAEATGAALHVEPLIGERRLYSCDIGTATAVLREAWAHLDFSALPDEVWWPTADESHASLTRRIEGFSAKWKERLADANCALVSHWYFLNAVTGRSMENCEIYFKKLF